MMAMRAAVLFVMAATAAGTIISGSVEASAGEILPESGAKAGGTGTGTDTSGATTTTADATKASDKATKKDEAEASKNVDVSSGGSLEVTGDVSAEAGDISMKVADVGASNEWHMTVGRVSGGFYEAVRVEVEQDVVEIDGNKFPSAKKVMKAFLTTAKKHSRGKAVALPQGTSLMGAYFEKAKEVGRTRDYTNRSYLFTCVLTQYSWTGKAIGKITLKDAWVTSHNYSGSESRPTENLSLSFNGIKY